MNFAKTKEYRELRKELLEDCESRGLSGAVYKDKVQEYMDLWATRQALHADVLERGIFVMDEKRGELAENRSVSLEAIYSQKLLAIFIALGFKDEAQKAKRYGDGDDEL